MAAKKKTSGVLKIAFALTDCVKGEGGATISASKGLRIELPEKEFLAMEKKDLVEAGVFVKMLEAVEGGSYSLQPHDETWLSSTVYEAWKEAGICEPVEGDLKILDRMKAQDEAVRTALSARDQAFSQRDRALAKVEGIAGDIHLMSLQMEAARAQAVQVLGMVMPDDESDEVPPGVTVELFSEIKALVEMFPDEGEAAPAVSEEPQLKLD